MPSVKEIRQLVPDSKVQTIARIAVAGTTTIPNTATKVPGDLGLYVGPGNIDIPPPDYIGDSLAQIVYKRGATQAIPFAFWTDPSAKSSFSVTIDGLAGLKWPTGTGAHILVEGGVYTADASPMLNKDATLEVVNRPGIESNSWWSTVPAGATEHTLNMTVKSQPGWEAPVGFRGTVQWKMWFYYDGGQVEGHSLDSVPLEFYQLPRPPSSLPWYDEKVGIPLGLLRMFILPTLWWRSWDWIGLVTKIVHGSRAPYTGADQSTAHHFLRYNTFDGQQHFTGQTNFDFQLDAWLFAHRAFTVTGKPALINCYDQAGACEVALALGIDAKQIASEFYQVYGFVGGEGELVGWKGKCNNPYFATNEALKSVAPTNPLRSPFRNHVFLSIGPFPEGFKIYTYDESKKLEQDSKDKGFDFGAKDPRYNPEVYKDRDQRFIVDACYGPVSGDMRRRQYLESIDKTTIPYALTGEAAFNRLSPEKRTPEKRQYHYDRWQPYHHWSSGVSSLVHLPADDPSHKLPEKLRKGDAAVFLGTQPLGYPANVDLTTLVAAFDASVRADRGSSVQAHPVLPSQEAVSFSVEHRLWYSLRVGDDVKQRYTYMAVYLHDMQERALKALQEKARTLAASTKATVDVFQDPNKVTTPEQGQMSVEARGVDSFVKIFLYETLLVEVGGPESFTADVRKYSKVACEAIFSANIGDKALPALKDDQWSLPGVPYTESTTPETGWDAARSSS